MAYFTCPFKWFIFVIISMCDAVGSWAGEVTITIGRGGTSESSIDGKDSKINQTDLSFHKKYDAT